MDGTPFWRTLRTLPMLVRPPPLPFALGLALQLIGVPEVAQTGAYTAAMVFGGPPMFRRRSRGCGPGTRRQNVMMNAATVGAAGIGAWTEAASAELRLDGIRNGRTR